MPNPDLIPEPFAKNGEKNTIPLERAISDPVYRATWLDGFPPDTRIPEEIGGEAPDGLDFNGLFNALSQSVVFLQKGNAYQFDVSLTPYPIGALVRSDDNLTTYQSIVASNSSNPNTDLTGWRVYNSSNFIIDNLTTNDSKKALSAAMGKKLQDEKLESPVGLIAYFTFGEAPLGWLKANGAAISRALYPELFGKIGIYYGQGDGSTTFNLPDLRGEFIRSWDDGRGVDSGRVRGLSQASAIQEHNHEFPFFTAEGLSGGNLAVYSYSGTFGRYTRSTGGSETRPRNIALLACIKY